MPVVQLELRVVVRVGEALVVAEVEIGLGAVVGDVHLAVLIRAHRAGIDVDVGVELLQRDLVAVAFEQAADRCRGQPLAERGHDAAGHEDVFGGRPSVLVMVSSIDHVRLRRTLPADAGAASRRRTLVEIFRRIDAERVVAGLHRLDADAVLERAQLFEGFGAFERRRLERGQHQQRMRRYA